MPCNYYNVGVIRRTMDDLREGGCPWPDEVPLEMCNPDRDEAEMEREKRQQKNQCFGFARPPLVNISLDNVVADELHLMLRITDVLLRNLIDEARDMDELQGVTDPLKGPVLSNLVATIKSCD